MALTSTLAGLKGVGTSRQALLSAAGLQTVGDLLTYMPYAYEDSSEILSLVEANTRLHKLPTWELQKSKIAVRGVLRKKSAFHTRRGFTIVRVEITDQDSGEEMFAVWFNQPYVNNELVEGAAYVLYGRVKKEGSRFSLQSPKFEQVIEGKALQKLGSVQPVYRRVKTVTSAYLRRFVVEIMQEETMPEYLDSRQLAEEGLLPLPESLRAVHAPETLALAVVGRRRVALQELLEVRAEFERKYTKSSAKESNIDNIQQMSKNIGRWIGQLPFKLTAGQEKVVASVLADLAKNEPLDALVYGDVGSGKTIIALLLLFATALAGQSGLFLVPTTILAAQHVKTARELIETLGLQSNVEVAEVVGGKKIVKPRGGVVYIGTQAILHQKALLENELIGFVCIDEQHRFGVEQRRIVKAEGRPTLTLSATPIPRSLALSYLGFSQAHMLTERPLGRMQTITKVVPNGKEEATYEWIKKRIELGEQAYLVFPRIVDSEETEQQSLLTMSEQLQEQFFKEIACGVLHGGMKDIEKQRVMADFASGKIRLLFSTSVIEVGVDVSNATVIAIHGAELFGLAQLHQLRGRVGRSSKQGYCLLFPSISSDVAAIRMEYFSTHHEGLQVAEFDLTSRGTGTLLGAQQSGLSELKIASLDDFSLLQTAATIYERLSQNGVAIPRYFRVKFERDQ